MCPMGTLTGQRNFHHKEGTGGLSDDDYYYLFINKKCKSCQKGNIFIGGRGKDSSRRSYSQCLTNVILISG